MPSRILKESIKTSDEIDSLSWFEEVVFYRLLVTADDYGCMDGRPVVVCNQLFPTKENVTVKSIATALSKLEAEGLIRRYSNEGHPYIYVCKWDKHQRVRNKVRRFPSPDDSASVDLTADCCQLSADCCQLSADCGRESNPNPNPNPNPKRAREDLDKSFDLFWKAYPRKDSKKEARQKWDRIAPDPPLVEKILADIARKKQTEQWRKDGGKYIPMPSTYLNQERWEDEGSDIPAHSHGYEEHRLTDEDAERFLTNLDD